MKFHTYLKTATRRLTASGQRNGIKILTLSIGLAVGLVLAAKVCFEQTYDDYYSDADRIVYLSEAAEQDGNLDIYPQTSGGIAPLMKEHYPEVEEASRMTFFESGASLIDVETSERFTADDVKLADSCYFKIFDRDCLAGNITSALGIKNNAAISSKMALAMGHSRNIHSAANEVIGKKFTIGSRGSDIVLTVCGVYEEFPANSFARPDVIVSLPSIGQFMYDGSFEILGNDRYQSFIKLKKGSTAESLNAKMDSFIQTYLPVEEMKAANFSMTFKAKPLTGRHLESSDVRNTILILGIVAFALLLVSVLNYMLIVISTCVTRSKEMALRKCLGSGRGEMLKMMMAEALVHTLIATVIAAIFLFAGKGFVENFLGMELIDLFTGKPLILAIGIILLVVFLNGFVPARIFDGIPVATAFRNYRENKRSWKLWLLIVEFALVSFLCVLIGAITAQYDRMTNADLGFSYENSIEVATPEAGGEEHKVLMNELRAMPEVEDACFAYMTIFPAFSGNNVRLPGRVDDLFNAQDLYYVDDHWLNVMGVELVEGRNFNTSLQSDDEVIVDTRFVEKLKATTGWDEVLGKQVAVSEHGSNVTIVGVINTINLGRFNSEEDNLFSRPMMVFYHNPDEPMGRYHYPYQYVRLKNFSNEAYERVRKTVQSTLPDQAVYTTPFKTSMVEGLRDTLETRNSILAGSIITLLIAILGLIGYTIDEIKRRAKEIAVRRISGSLFSQIRILFQKDTLRIAIPSAIVGCAAGIVAALRWEENFTMQIGMPWWIVAGAFLFTLAVVAVVTDMFVSKVANTNPAESIKTE